MRSIITFCCTALSLVVINAVVVPSIFSQDDLTFSQDGLTTEALRKLDEAATLNADGLQDLNYGTTVTNLYRVGSKKNVKYFGFGAVEESQINELSEDCRVLNHLLTRSIQTTATRNRMGVRVTYSFGQNDAMYVEGRGLILTYHVGFPLVPDEDETESIKENSDSVDEWEKARSEIEGVQSGRQNIDYVKLNPGKAKYDQEQVEKLADGVVNALSHAGKIRNLKSSDSVTIYVRGPSVANPNQMSVMAWQVNMSDTRSDQTVSNDKIRSVKYFEPKSSGSDYFSHGIQGYSR